MKEFDKYVESFIGPLYGEKPQLSTEELTELAQDTFGVTTDFSVGAYMTPDGKLLDFRDGRSQYRNDHRNISSIGYDMQEFIDAGNIWNIHKYEGQEEVIYNNFRYKVLRTFKPEDKNEIEIVCYCGVRLEDVEDGNS